MEKEIEIIRSYIQEYFVAFDDVVVAAAELGEDVDPRDTALAQYEWVCMSFRLSFLAESAAKIAQKISRMSNPNGPDAVEVELHGGERINVKPGRN
jgi:hypothetical protein